MSKYCAHPSCFLSGSVRLAASQRRKQDYTLLRESWENYSAEKKTAGMPSKTHPEELPYDSLPLTAKRGKKA